MNLKGTILYKQLIAVLLLLVLFSVTVIQLSHSHASVSSAATQKKIIIKKSVLPGYYNAAAESRCFICEYQLTRDADANHTVFNIQSPFQHPVSIAELYSFIYPGTYSFIETRGPPSII